jgi:hypothetical protein
MHDDLSAEELFAWAREACDRSRAAVARSRALVAWSRAAVEHREGSPWAPEAWAHVPGRGHLPQR